MTYVDVILPLPLDGLFTYSVPESMDGKLCATGQPLVQPYVRAKVPFGLTKTHTALIVRVHKDEPQEGIVIKPIIAILDEAPVLLDEQYEIWKWISNYYMSPLGDIMKAALPQGIKKEERYRPRTETYVTVTDSYRSEQSLHNALNILTRSPKQLEVFNTFLELSHFLVSDNTSPEVGGLRGPEVTKEELMNESHCNSSHIKALIDRGMLRLYDKEVGRLNNAGDAHPENIKPLSEAQQEAFEALRPHPALPEGRVEDMYKQPACMHTQTYDEYKQPTCMHTQSYDMCKQPADMHKQSIGNSVPSPRGGQGGAFLLHGVTSSGKTEIYIHLIQEAIERGEQVMYLLPEIALTVQITQRLQHVFGNRLGIYHSKYSDAERVEIWQKQLSDEPYDVILGARSAVFLPYKKLGLVIIDEEHETSFKQQDPSPRYHARSVAMMIARKHNARVLLGTATPSAESYYNAITGKYRLVTLTQRYKGLQLPQIQVVDVKDLRHRKIMKGMLSPQLKEAVSEALQNGEQAIIFQNRRGFSPIIECHQCGWSPKCPNCDVSLTYHKTLSSLTCHYCGYSYPMPRVCPDCKNPDLRDRGAGTEKVEDIIAETFPNARISRMDLDTTRTRNAYERIIAEFASGKTNLLIGTQMVTKGLDFDNVSVVGILSADTMLNQPDFRAYEHAFMMMTQVAGRAGRKGHLGKVILQTTHPGLPVISQIVRNDFPGFFRQLMEERNAFHYPPFTRLIDIYLRHKDDNTVNSAAIELGSRLRQSFKDRVLGPDRPAIARIKTLCIRKIVLKLEPTLSIAQTRQCIRQATAAIMQDPRYKSLQISYDVDPL